MKKRLLIIVLFIFIIVFSAGCGKASVEKSTLIKKGTIEQITVHSLPEYYNYCFSAKSDIQAVTDYLLNLTLSSDFEENPNDYAGMTWVITLKYDDGSETVIYHFGNRFIRSGESSWYQMQYEEASQFDALMDELG